MKVIKQASASENAFAAASNLIRLLNVNVSVNSIREIIRHPEYPSISSISNYLSNWRINNITINSTLTQLKEIPYPAIAHLHRNNGHFVILKKLEQNQLTYIDPELGEKVESLYEFEKKWSGVVLLVEANKNSGEENYKAKRKIEVFERVCRYVVWTLIVTIPLTTFLYLPTNLFPLFFLKIVGSTFCIALLQKQFGIGNSSINAFCKMGTKTDCDAVIHSPASRLFGLVHLSELGAWYFIGGLLTIMVSSLTAFNLSALLSFSFAVLPFSFYTIHYQWRVIKKWCPLCLAVMAVFGLECLVSYFGVLDFQISWVAVYTMFIAFVLPLIFWITVRKRFMESFNLPALEKNLNRFIKSEQVFQSLLLNQQVTETGNFEIETILGKVKAPIVITMVTNPTCGPCGRTHKILESFLELFENEVSIKYRFMVNPNDNLSASHQVINHLISLQLTDQESEFQSAMSNWFSRTGEKDLKKWKNDYPLKTMTDDATVHEIINQHYQWCKKSGITATPTVFINGKLMPEEFSIQDLKFQIRKMVEQLLVNVPEPVS